MQTSCPERLELKSFFSILCLVLAGCAAQPRVVFYQLNDLERLTKKSLDRAVWENAVPLDKDVLNTPLSKDEYASYHLVQVRTQEKSHVHENHDLAVFVQSGEGTMFLGKESFKVRAGSVIFIRHGIVHYFVNEGPSPAAAIAVFSPPFDGKDIIFR